MSTTPASTRPDAATLAEIELVIASLTARLDASAERLAMLEARQLRHPLPRVVDLGNVELRLVNGQFTTTIRAGSVEVDHGKISAAMRVTDDDVEIRAGIDVGTNTVRSALYAGSFGSDDPPQAMVTAENDLNGERWEELR